MMAEWEEKQQEYLEAEAEARAELEKGEKALAEGYQKMVDAYSGSVQKLIDLAESTSDEALKAKILMDLLDRVGGKAKQAVDLDARVDGTVEIAPVSAEEKIKRLKELAKAFEK